MENCYLAGAKRFIILFNKNLLCSTICQTQYSEQNKQDSVLMELTMRVFLKYIPYHPFRNKERRQKLVK